MEDYRLEQSGQQVQDILNGAAMQVDLNSEVERATEAENILDGKIDDEEERAKVAEKANADDIDAIEEKIPSGASSSNKLATASDVNDEAQARSNADQTINGKIDAIDAKIPSGASSENKLATEEYVDDSVATNTATFRGTYNLVSDLGLLPSATHDQIAYALGGEIATADNNDYCFVQIPTSSETPTQIAKIERYKFNGDAWAFEYDLNNSGFTAAQWSAINSGITSGDVTKLSALPTNAELTTLLNGKQDTLTFDNTPTENSNNPVKSGGVYSSIKAEETRAKAAEKANADDIDAIEEKIPSGATSSNKLATESDVTGEATTRENADAALQQAIEAILLLIPSAATSLNQLADKAFVNSSIATNTATFRGTFNSVSDLHLSISATHEQIGTMLASSIVTADNNDYAFVQIPTSAHRPTEIARTERYKFNGTTWEYEYDLNNSGYTTAQWAAINSTITQELVTKLSALPNNDDLTTALSVLTDSISTINAKIPSSASSDNKLVDTTEMQTYIAQLLDVLDATYNVTSTDGHVTVQITQTNGKVTAFTVTTSDIASAADLELIAGRVTTAEGNISTNAEDIAQLQAAYAALTQNDLVIIQPTDTWPVANPAENIIYRVVDRVNTPPEYYSDYMWNGTTMVLMAQYNNAIDPRPKKGSTNLVESGGVFDNMGALDVSELNATENPHTLATYTDLSAAIAAIPSDYQKGGMSIKFVSSVDNKYIQARCIAQNFTTDVTQWQGVDVTVMAGSTNLIESGAVAEIQAKRIVSITTAHNHKYIDSEGTVKNANGYSISNPISLKDGETIEFICYAASTSYLSQYLDGAYIPIYYGSIPQNTKVRYKATNDIDVVVCGSAMSNTCSIYTESAPLGEVERIANVVDNPDTNVPIDDDNKLITGGAVMKALQPVIEFEQARGTLSTGVTSKVGKTYIVYTFDDTPISNTGVEIYCDEYYSAADKIVIDEVNKIYEFTPTHAKDIRVYNGGIYMHILLVDKASSLKNIIQLLIPVFNKIETIHLNSVTKLTISEWNIGYWNNGVTPYGVLDADVDTYMPRVKELLTKICSDVLIITEWVNYFDRSQTISSYTALLEQFYPYKYLRGEDKPAIFSKYPIVGSTGTFSDERTYTRGIITVNERQVVVAAIHLVAREDEANIRVQEHTDLVTEYANSPYVIVTGDFNNYTQDELAPYVNAGWTLGNGGYFGNINTYKPSQREWYIDNIVTKGFNIDNFKAILDDERAGVSDHYPVSSEISCFL